MPDPSLRTTHLHRLVAGLRAGDAAARDELARAVYDRVGRIARRMLRGFPNVRGHADTGDVLQATLLRLLRTLENLRPGSTRDFFSLAAVHVRRELLDLARHYRREAAARHAPPGDAPAPDPADPHSADTGLDLWASFHEAVERLPAEQREVVGLVFYHGWTHEQIAELLQVTDRTVRRWWRSACSTLRDELGGAWPDTD